ncbi:hypothetical protein [Xanthomonas phaseoli]|uniref:hypothetical protein n=1 Tax=Xanthomonas phaseoli TaxID=1985254 RepID=UPI0003638B3E|nr:hypothetical protein [Xanthomonas phaseoli]
MCRMTNVEVVTELMEFSQYGALAQAFVMAALTKHSRAVADADPATLASMEGGLVSPAAWQAVAREIAEKLDKHFAA